VKYVYLIQSKAVPEQRYIGLTDDLFARLNAHNAGKSLHTRKHRPWKLVVALRFENDFRAIRFERYLKTGSGWAFAHKRFW
jgi:predicted GIY-YIG superfamily endonuclease